MDEMKTGQQIWLFVFVAGLASFFYFGSDVLSKHTAWTEFQTPAGVGDICLVLSGAEL